MADRGTVLGLLAAAPLLAASAAARAQAGGKVWRIGWLGPASGPNEAVDAGGGGDARNEHDSHCHDSHCHDGVG